MGSLMTGVERSSRVGRRVVVAHAVPAGDRTRSAVCGSSVRRTDLGWDADAAGTCPDCRALLARAPEPLPARA